MAKFLQYTLAVLINLPSFVFAAEPVSLSENTYKADLGVIVIQMNWGRRWKCGTLQQASLASGRRLALR